MELTRDASEYHAGERPRQVSPRSSSMTATTITSNTAAATRPCDPGRIRVFRAAARAEWTKMRSVRSTIWTLLVAVALAIGFGALVGVTQVNSWDTLDPAERARFDPTSFSLSGLFLAQLAIGVLGVLHGHLRVRDRADPSHSRRHPTTPHRPGSQGDHIRRCRVRRRTGRLVQRLRHRPGDLLVQRNRRFTRATPACCGRSSAVPFTSPPSVSSGSDSAPSSAAPPERSPHSSASS